MGQTSVRNADPSEAACMDPGTALARMRELESQLGGSPMHPHVVHASPLCQKCGGVGYTIRSNAVVEKCPDCQGSGWLEAVKRAGPGAEVARRQVMDQCGLEDQKNGK